MEWKTVKLGDILKITGGQLYKGDLLGSGDNLLLGMGCVSFLEKFLLKGARQYGGDCLDKNIGHPGDIVLATRQQSDNLPILAMPAIIPEGLPAKKIIIGSNLYKVNVTDPDFDNRFIYWLLKTPEYVNYISSVKTGTTVKMITIKDVESYTFLCPPKEIRDKISKLLWDLDDKIENNNRINRNLEAQAQALFKSWFVDFEPWGGTMPDDWKEDSLTNIADFLNGLAMQKFPAKDIENSLPVLKIKELGQKHCDESSDRCTKEIKPEYIIHDGDVIFSWSGTLLVDIWCGGDCGLNQHLFKVSSNKYPKWFYYLWTIQHLQNFKRIASDKAVTMGHIKRGDLDKSIVLIPNDNVLEKMTAIMTPLLDSIISNAQESTRLAALRDTLLPKLMKGEIAL